MSAKGASGPAVLDQKDALGARPSDPPLTEGKSKKTAVAHHPAAKKKRLKKRKGGRKRCRTRASPRYRRMVRRWQKRPKIPKPRYREGFRDLVLYSVNHGERIRVFPYLPDGNLDPQVLQQIETLFRDKALETTHPVHPRLVKLLYRLVDRFKAQQITVICGFRESLEKNEGNHTRGRAVDFTLPGVPLAALARQARQLGHVGVGFYPNSGFVHLDVRDGPSFFWIDRSGPGKATCLRRILSKSARKFDRRWRPAHDSPKRHKNRKGVLLGALPKPVEGPENRSEQTGSKTERTRGL